MRDMEKTIEKSQAELEGRHHTYTLRADELYALYTQETKCHAIMKAFDYGFILGQRSVKNSTKKSPSQV